jgi:hypothetical protein
MSWYSPNTTGEKSTVLLIAKREFFGRTKKLQKIMQNQIKRVSINAQYSVLFLFLKDLFLNPLNLLFYFLFILKTKRVPSTAQGPRI